MADNELDVPMKLEHQKVKCIVLMNDYQLYLQVCKVVLWYNMYE